MSGAARCILLTAIVGTSASAADEQPILLRDIVVENAARDERAVLDTPVGVTVVPRQELERRNADTFEELIGDVSGVLIEGGPRGAAQEPNIRGFSDEQIVLRIDGGRFNFNQAHRGRFFIDPDIVQEVEVIRGGGSTVQGSGALGGVIALETRGAYDLLENGQNFGARFRSSFDTNGAGFGQTATVYGATGGFDALGFIAYRDMGSDQDDGSGADIRASQIDIVNGLGKLGLELGEAARIEGVFSYYADDGVTPSAADGEATDTNIVDRDGEIFTGRLAFEYAPLDDDLIDLSVLGYVNTLEITEDRIDDGRADRTDYDTFGFELTNRSSFDLGAPFSLVYGVELLRDEQSGRRDGADRLQFPDAAITTYSAFAEAEIEIAPGLTILPGVRFDRFDLDADGFDDRSDSELSPRVGISYRPIESVQIYGNYARAFRAPSLTELYSDDVHFATPGFVDDGVSFTGVNNFVPTPNLKPETSDQFEVGVRFSERDVIRKGDAFSVSVGGYYARVDDFIDTNVEFLDFNTGVFDPTTGLLVVNGTTTNVNVDAELWGAEIEARYDAGIWYATLAGSLPRGEARGSGEPLGSLPQDRLTIGAGFRPWPGVEIGGRATFAADRSSGGVDTDAYEVVDVFASYAPTDGPLEGVTLRVGVDNLLDETFNLHPNALNQPGRSFVFAGAVKF